MADEIQVYEVVHTSPELKTVYDFISDTNSPAFNYEKEPDTFLKVKNVKGITNREVIENSYNTNEEKKLKGKSSKELILKLGTRLAIEAEKVNKTGLLTEGLEITTYDIPAFKAKALADLEVNENYKVSTFNKAKGGKLSKGSVSRRFPDMTVWIWCRALASKENNNEGEILNVTPFVQIAETDMDKNGGQFQLTLPPLICELDSSGKWVIKKNNIKFYKGKNNSLQKTDYVAQGLLYEEESGELKRNIFLFHTILSPQDLVFIRFETLDMETAQRATDNDKLSVPKSSLPDRIYDMIGLIDVNSVSVQSSSTDVSINITGRDLSKLFLEDGAYVFNLEMAQGMLGGPGSTSTNVLSKRLIADKSFQYLNLYFNNSIEKIIKFVFSQLTNIKVVPDTLFEHYFDKEGKDRRNYRYENEDQKSTKKQDDKDKYKENAKSLIGEARKKVNLNAGSVQKEKSKVEEIYQELYRFLKDIRAKGVRVVTADNETDEWKPFTYINKRGVPEEISLANSFPDYFNEEIFKVEVTSVVIDARPIVVNVDKVIDLEQSDKKNEVPLKTTPAPGIWQIIKLALDSNVTGRKIIDSSLSTANGSLINFFRKACQEPFVEMLFDTYGDMYYLTVRKPPTDRVGILSMLEAKVTVEGQANTGKSTVAPSERAIAGTIDIEADDVLFEELSFDDSEAISWYHLQPQANFLGGVQFSLAYLPAVFLPEYAEIWGSRPMQLQHNYLPTVAEDTDKDSLDKIQKQAVEDLRFMIESNAYLPFTRKGIIKTNGDRRYKVGNLVRYKPTGEIFHIDHVKHEFKIGEKEIDRVSTIMVSRGMIEQLIYGIPSRSKDDAASFISYFNIVNTKPVYSYNDITTFTDQQIKVGEKLIQPTAEEEAAAPFASLTPSSLHPYNKNTHLLYLYPKTTMGVFVELIKRANALGWYADVQSTVRTYEQQYALYKKRSIKNPVAAPGSKAGHEAGKAIDVNFFQFSAVTPEKLPGDEITSFISRETNRISKQTSQTRWLQSGIPTIAEQLGLRWGGFFNDNNHFQFNSKTAAAQQTTEDVYETKRVPVHEKSLDIGKIFSNIKVNAEVFNFFLRKEQLNTQYSKVKDKGVYSDDGVKNLPGVTIKATK